MVYHAFLLSVALFHQSTSLNGETMNVGCPPVPTQKSFTDRSKAQVVSRPLGPCNDPLEKYGRQTHCISQCPAPDRSSGCEYLASTNSISPPSCTCLVITARPSGSEMLAGREVFKVCTDVICCISLPMLEASQLPSSYRCPVMYSRSLALVTAT